MHPDDQNHGLGIAGTHGGKQEMALQRFLGY